jgi:hypothetical protein
MSFEHLKDFLRNELFHFKVQYKITIYRFLCKKMVVPDPDRFLRIRVRPGQKLPDPDSQH